MMCAKEISERAHVGTTTHQGAPRGPDVPRWVVPTWGTSLGYYLGHFFIAREIQKTYKTWHFILFN